MSHAPGDLEIFLWTRPTTVAEEWAWGQDLCRRMLVAEVGAGPVRVYSAEVAPTVADALEGSRAAAIGVVLDDVSFWGETAWGDLRSLLQDDPGLTLVAPVSNEASVAEQKMAPPFVYQTPSVLRLACAEMKRRHGDTASAVASVDPFAYLVRRNALESLDPTTPLADVPSALSSSGARLAVARGTYAHRYARIHDQPRPDLQEWVPEGAESLLDLGCATGELGVAVKAKGPCRVVGIELNPALAEVAEKRIDRVLRENVETMPVETFGEEFDCIVCGDVLEHLVDPWTIVEKLAGWLRPGARLVATLPNVGHWSLVADLLAGRWDLIPFGLLCYGHLRFFTRPGIEHLFGRAGLEIERLIHMKDGLPPAGEEFLARATSLVPDVDRESLETNEFLVVAKKGGTAQASTRRKTPITGASGSSANSRSSR